MQIGSFAPDVAQEGLRCGTASAPPNGALRYGETGLLFAIDVYIWIAIDLARLDEGPANGRGVVGRGNGERAAVTYSVRGMIDVLMLRR